VLQCWLKKSQIQLHVELKTNQIAQMFYLP
jgi:hypothetical protein